MFEEVKKVLLEFSENEDIKEDSVLTSDLGLSSFDVIAVVTAFEEKFDIEIPDRAISKFVTVKDIVEYLEKN